MLPIWSKTFTPSQLNLSAALRPSLSKNSTCKTNREITLNGHNKLQRVGTGASQTSLTPKPFSCLAHLLDPDSSYLIGHEIREDKRAFTATNSPRSALPDAKSEPSLTVTSPQHCIFMASKLSAFTANPFYCHHVSKPNIASMPGHNGTLDSGSEVHLFTYEAALQLFSSLGVSKLKVCLLYTSPSPRDGLLSRMPSSA